MSDTGNDTANDLVRTTSEAGVTTVTLDELCDQAGAARLPYLEDVPPEIRLPDDVLT